MSSLEVSPPHWQSWVTYLSWCLKKHDQSPCANGTEQKVKKADTWTQGTDVRCKRKGSNKRAHIIISVNAAGKPGYPLIKRKPGNECTCSANLVKKRPSYSMLSSERHTALWHRPQQQIISKNYYYFQFGHGPTKSNSKYITKLSVKWSIAKPEGNVKFRCSWFWWQLFWVWQQSHRHWKKGVTNCASL